MEKDVKTKEDKWEKMEKRRRINGKRCEDEEGQMGKNVKTKKDRWEKILRRRRIDGKRCEDKDDRWEKM